MLRKTLSALLMSGNLVYEILHNFECRHFYFPVNINGNHLCGMLLLHLEVFNVPTLSFTK